MGCMEGKMPEAQNVFEVTITYTDVAPSLHEVWKRIRDFSLPTKVDIIHKDRFYPESKGFSKNKLYER